MKVGAKESDRNKFWILSESYASTKVHVTNWKKIEVDTRP